MKPRHFNCRSVLAPRLTGAKGMTIGEVRSFEDLEKHLREAQKRGSRGVVILYDIYRAQIVPVYDGTASDKLNAMCERNAWEHKLLWNEDAYDTNEVYAIGFTFPVIH